MAKFWKKKNDDEEVIEDAKIIEEVTNSETLKEGPIMEEEKPHSEFDNIKDKAKEFVHEVSEKSKEVAQTIGEKAPEVAEAVVEKTKEVAHNISERAPGVADTVLVKTKKFAAAVVEKTEEAVAYGKLKLKLHNQRSQLNKILSELGDRVYILISKKADIPADEEVKTITGRIKELKKEIIATEKEIEEVGHHPDEEEQKEADA